MKKDSDFQIEVFLEDNYRLFAIMGIFGALSIYLDELYIDYNIPILQLGIMACFTLFILTSLVIFERSFRSYSDKPIPLSVLTMNKGNVERFLFIIPFSMLIMTIIYFISTTFQEPLNALLGMILYISGMMVYFGFLSLIVMETKNKLLTIGIGSLVLAVISCTGYYYMEKYSLIPLCFFFSSLVTGSVISLIMIPILYLYKKHKTKK